MATIIQKNGMKALSNGAVNHLVMDQFLMKEPVQAQDQLQLQTMQAQNSIVEQCVRETEEPEPEIDIVINNVVCSFTVKCHLNLRQIALNGINVEYRREHGMVTMKLRKPYTTASIWSSGKITCTGATSEIQSHIAARRFARRLQKLGFNTRFANFRIVNVLGTCSMPFAIKINAFSEHHKPQAEYEPELHPGVTFKLKQPKATLKIFSTGSITVTAPCVNDVQQAIEHIYPLVYQFRKERTKEDELLVSQKIAQAQGRKRKVACVESEESGEDSDDSCE
uniref:TATA box-binding protein-like 1 n=1 Tax=Graphocephala atropunctata TaxID=36148 RepID=A0A1B6MNQ1_9HEMI